jgi:hypothetical protein
MSVERRLAQAGALYTNVKDVRAAILNADGTGPAAWVAAGGAPSTLLIAAGAGVFRDMGKTVYIPDPTVVGSSAPSTILRKIQLVPQGAAQTGTGVGSEAAGTYYTGYFRVGAVDGLTGGLVRIA